MSRQGESKTNEVNVSIYLPVLLAESLLLLHQNLVLGTGVKWWWSGGGLEGGDAALWSRVPRQPHPCEPKPEELKL